MKVPEWWLVISGVFFALGIVVLVAYVVLAFYMLNAAKTLQAQLKATGTKVDALADKVNTLADTTHGLVSHVGGRASGLLDTVAAVAKGAASRFESFATILLTVFTILNLRKVLPKRNAD